MGAVKLARGVAELHPLEEDGARSSLGKKAQGQPCQEKLIGCSAPPGED